MTRFWINLWLQKCKRFSSDIYYFKCWIRLFKTSINSSRLLIFVYVTVTATDDLYYNICSWLIFSSRKNVSFLHANWIILLGHLKYYVTLMKLIWKHLPFISINLLFTNKSSKFCDYFPLLKYISHTYVYMFNIDQRCSTKLFIS